VADPSLELLHGLVHSFEESARLCREAAALPDAERLALGLPIGELDQLTRRVRLEVLEGVVAKLKGSLEQAQLAAGCCTSWIDMNGTRLGCESPQGHEGPHQKKMSARADKQRIDATMSWTIETYLQKVQ
jgi:hypothetical protein